MVIYVSECNVKFCVHGTQGFDITLYTQMNRYRYTGENEPLIDLHNVTS